MLEFKRVSLQEAEYIPSVSIGVKKPLTFTYKPLTAKQLAIFSDQTTKYDVQTGRLILGTSEIDYEVARTAITGWKNLIVDGEELVYRKGYDGKFDETLLQDIEGMFDILVEVGKYIAVVSRFPDMAK